MSDQQGRQEGHDGGGTLRWLLTYADMITLLMAFFIMLYSMSVLNLNRFREVAVSIRSGFGGAMSGQSKSIISKNGELVERSDDARNEIGELPWKVVRKLQEFVKKEQLGKSIKLRVDERGLVISIVSDKVLFEKGKADLSPSAKHIIAAVANALKQAPNHVRVEGHTCNLPVSSSRFPSNWELSTARATTVVRFLIEYSGIPASRLSAAGYADSKPLVPNINEKNRAINRRVDMVVLRSGYQDSER